MNCLCQGKYWKCLWRSVADESVSEYFFLLLVFQKLFLNVVLPVLIKKTKSLGPLIFLCNKKKYFSLIDNQSKTHTLKIQNVIKSKYFRTDKLKKVVQSKNTPLRNTGDKRSVMYFFVGKEVDQNSDIEKFLK